MPDRQSGPTRSRTHGGSTQPTLLRRFHEHTPNSAQVVGFLTLIISGGILLLLTGLTLTATALALIFFTPLIILSSPIWIPVGIVLFFATAGFFTACAFGLTALAGASWMYKYVKGRHSPGSDGIEYARSRIADTAGHMKDYAKEYGGYWQSRVKHAAPGA
ncbi:oleosin G-like [Aristolochia californica]|uniref:oleosin G-like n=1 Tax=Aristolochia californica TaxID=171875 RepID=UPI0035D5FEAF